MRLQGDELTLKAAVNAYKVTLHAVTSNHENWHLKYDPDFEHTKLDPYMSTNNRKKLFLAYISPVHYNSILPVANSEKPNELGTL